MAVKLYLKEWRDIRGITLVELAARTEFPLATLSRLEMDDGRQWNSEQLASLANTLDVDPADLLKPPPR